MNTDQYREKYRGEFKAHEKEAWFVALMAVLKDQHPLKTLSQKPAGDRLAGAAVFLNEMKGYEDAMKVIEAISVDEEKQPEETPADYSEEPVVGQPEK